MADTWQSLRTSSFYLSRLQEAQCPASPCPLAGLRSGSGCSRLGSHLPSSWDGGLCPSLSAPVVKCSCAVRGQGASHPTTFPDECGHVVGRQWDGPPTLKGESWKPGSKGVLPLRKDRERGGTRASQEGPSLPR